MYSRMDKETSYPEDSFQLEKEALMMTRGTPATKPAPSNTDASWWIYRAAP